MFVSVSEAGARLGGVSVKSMRWTIRQRGLFARHADTASCSTTSYRCGQVIPEAAAKCSWRRGGRNKRFGRETSLGTTIEIY